MTRRLILCSLLLVVLGPAVARAQAAPDRWVLEFGPFVGFYDFDSMTAYEDFGLFGARLGAHVSPWLRMEASFEEVYTERSSTGNRARQVSFALHGRIEPWRTRLAPFALVGAALVILDDSDDPDTYGDAFDMGLGLRWMADDHWAVRGEWVLRRQEASLWRIAFDALGDPFLDEEPVTLWGRALRIGASYVF